MLKISQWWSVLGVCAALLAGPALAHPDAAHVQAEGAWARASVPGQQATGAFVRLTAQEPLRLVGVETPVAPVAQVHEMRMDGDVMRMRAVTELDLPAGQTVSLQPGGYHLMLQQLTAPLTEGSEIALTLVFEDAQRTVSRLHLKVPVHRMAPRSAAAGHAAPAPAGGGHHAHH